jgi:hypothetical protein
LPAADQRPALSGLVPVQGPDWPDLNWRQTMVSKVSNPEAAGDDAVAHEATAQATVAKAAGERRSTTDKSKRPGRMPGEEPVARKPVTSRPASPKTTKADLVLKRLRSSKGASIEMLIAETGWHAHSVRGFLSAMVKKKLGLNLLSEVGKDGVRRYRIDGDTKSA